MGLVGIGVAVLALAGCSSLAVPGPSAINVRNVAATDADAPVPLALSQPSVVVADNGTRGPAHIESLIDKYAALYNVPETLIRRVVMRESRFNPKARNGPYWGLMQIRYDTAQSMGYRGPASGLLDADTNLRYGVKYLAGAYLVADANADQAMRNYASGYYYKAKQKGLLAEVGLD